MKKLIVLFTLIFAFTAFAAEKMVKLNVAGMTCNGCVTKVEKSLKAVEGVSDAKVSLDEKSATITLASNSKTTTDVLVKAITEAGFTASEGKIDGASVKSKKECGDCNDGECKDGKGAGKDKKEMNHKQKKETKEIKKS